MRIKALLFDVFGTVVDWRGSIVAEGRAACADADWPGLAEAWAAAYTDGVKAIRRGERPWAPLSELLEQAFTDLARRFDLGDVPAETRQRLTTAWRRLRPWPDAVAGFDRLAGRVELVALTNADAAMLAELALFTRLPWDRLLSAGDVKAYKPDPSVYRMAVEQLGIPPGELMMVASHAFDLNAAHKLGFGTALVRRPSEYAGELDHTPDLIVADMEELAATIC